MNAEQSEEVFISYSWDSEEHVTRVLELSNRLRADGIDCVLDQYEAAPQEGWPSWMERKVRLCHKVLVVCTENYLARLHGEEPSGKGLGAKWEGKLIYQHIYNSDSTNAKFIPVLFSAEDIRHIPIPLQGTSRYAVDSESGYRLLIRRLLGLAPADKPPLGTRPSAPARAVKTDIAMYIHAPIEITLWDEAKWRGVFFMGFPDAPPVLGLGFLNGEKGRAIFEGWRKRYGSEDKYEELRISITEGPIKDEEDGYTVNIGADPDNTMRRYKDAGMEIEDEYMLTMINRLNRMNPPSSSPNLANFKASYKSWRRYLLIPGKLRADRTSFEPFLDLGIFKENVVFRHSSEIGEHDLDSIVLGTGSQTRSKVH